MSRGTPAEELCARLREKPIKPHEVTRFLDSLSHPERVEAIRAVGRAEQRALYEAVDGYESVTLADLVPRERADLEPVRHFGKNTLPLFSRFEKRFCRPGDTDAEKPDVLYGFNFQAMERVTGPGYFVAHDAGPRPEVLVDYTHVPPQRPESWPEIRRNEIGLSRFVYGHMIDTLRRVSEHVTIGSAARKGKDLGSWFLLTRCDEGRGES